MAKEKEEKDFKTLETAFQPEVEQESATEVEDTTEDKVDEAITDELAETEKDTEASEEESATEDKVETAEPTWAALGLERFDGLTREQIAREVKWRDQKFGDLGNELGTIRKEIAESKKSKEKEEVKPDVLSQIPDMSEGEVTDYNERYDKNPVRTILEYSRPHIKQMIADEIKSGVSTAVGESVGAQQENIAFTNFMDKHDDAEQHVPFMKTLDGEQYLGAQKRPYEDLYGLSALGKGKDPLYSPTYQLMSAYPNMTFAKAKELAGLQLTASGDSDSKLKQVHDDVNKINAVNKTASKKAKSQTISTAKTVDEAFDIPKED